MGYQRQQRLLPHPSPRPPPCQRWPLLAYFLLLLWSPLVCASVLRSLPLSPRSMCRGEKHACALLPPSPTSAASAPHPALHRRLLCWGKAYNRALGRSGSHIFDDLGDDEFPSAGGYVDLGRGVHPLAVACGETTTCVLVATASDMTDQQLHGRAICFGEVNFYTRFWGDTVNVDSAVTVRADTSSSAVAVSIGESHMCMLSTKLRLACTGESYLHGYGPGSPEVVKTTNLRSRGYVQLGAPAVDVACGQEHTCALTTALQLRCFGDGEYGRLGYGNENFIGDNEHPKVAGPVVLGASVLFLGLGGRVTCAVTTGLRLRCFGSGYNGQLGLGHNRNIGDTELPSRGGAAEVGAAVIMVAAATYHGCCVTSGLQLRCWGKARFGVLGYGRATIDIGRDGAVSEGGRVPLGTEGSSPRLQLPGTGVARMPVAVSSFDLSTCVLTARNEVLCWGGNDGQYLGYPGLRSTCVTTTPADYGAVQLGGGVGGGPADPSFIRILWCDSHFGNATSVRSHVVQDKQQLASCALGFPFTLAAIGTPSSPQGAPPTLSLHRSSSNAKDAQCAMQPTIIMSTVTTLAVLCSSSDSSDDLHAHNGAHYLTSLQVRLPLTRLVYTVEQATVPPVTTLALDNFRTPFSTDYGLTNRHHLLFLLGSSRPTNARYVIATTAAGDGSRQQFTTNSTRLWLSVTSDGAHNLTVYAVDAAGVADLSPLSLHWLADFTAPSTTIVSGPVQPVAATPTAHFKFGCSDSSRGLQQQQQQLGALCSYRLAMRQNSEDRGSSASSVVGGVGGSTSDISKLMVSVTPVTILHTTAAMPVSASAHVAFRVSGGGAGTQGGGGREYRVLPHSAAVDSAVQHYPWHTIAAADSSIALTLRNLPDGAYVLQLRGGSQDSIGDGGSSSSQPGSVSSVAFAVDTTPPRTRVQNVTRDATSDGRSAHWHVKATDFDCGGSGGGSAIAAMWWVAEAAETSSSPPPLPSSPPPLPAQWRRVNISAAAVVSLPTSPWATVLRVKVEDAAGNVDPFPRTISWSLALSLRSAPRVATFQASATFSLTAAAALPPANQKVTRPPLPLTVRWRLDGAAWQPATSTNSIVSIYLPSLAPGPHVWEVQPVAHDGSPDAVQSTPVAHTWEVLSSLGGSGMTFTDLSDGPHELEVRAVDVAGNVDSSGATYHWRVDTTPPLCSAAIMDRGAALSNSGRLSVNGSEPMVSVQLRLGNESSSSADWSSVSATPPRQYLITSLPAVSYDGLHMLSVKATDSTGHTTVFPCAVLQWLVDTTPPTVSLLQPPLSANSAAAVMNRLVWNATLLAQDRLSPVTSISFAAVPSRGGAQHAATTSTVRWEGVPLPWNHQHGGELVPTGGGGTATTAAAVRVFVSVSGDGRYSLWLKAVDLADNAVVVPAVFNWTVDTTPPSVTLHAAAKDFATLPAITAHHSLSLCVHFSEPLASLWWAVTGRYVPMLSQEQQRPAWIAESVRSGVNRHCMNVTTPPEAPDGQYALALKATDTAGNSWCNNTLHVWFLDTAPPTSCTVSTPSATVNSSRVAVSFGPFGGPQGIVGHWYALETTDMPWVWKPTGGTRSVVMHLPAPLTRGHDAQHMLQVKAVDAVGNVGTHPCASLSVTVDTTPPVTTVQSPVQGATLRAPPPRITLQHSELVVRVRWWRQGRVVGNNARHVVSPITPPSYTTSIVVADDDSADGPKVIWMQAEDTVGNLEATPVRFSWVKDTSAPSIAIAGNPVPSQRLSSTRLMLTVIADDNDNNLLFGRQGASGVWYSAHAQTTARAAQPRPLQWTRIPIPVMSAPSAAKYSMTINVVVSDDGWYSLALKAVDAAGNTAVNGSALRWAVDTTPPTARIASAPLNTSLGRSTAEEVAHFSFHCESITACKPWGGHQPCAPVADCTSYRYRVMFTAVGLDSSCSEASELIPWTASPSPRVALRSGSLRAGSLRLEVKAVDTVGLLQPIASVHRWVVSPSQEVVISVVARPPSLSAWDTAMFTFKSSMGGAPYSGQRFQLRLDTDTGPWRTLSLCSISRPTCTHELHGIARGAHSVHARAVDSGSGIPSASVTVQWALGVCNATAYAQVSPSNGALRCILCPAGANCTADNVTLPSMGAQIGWWAAAGRVPSVQFYPCPLPNSCQGGGNTNVTSVCAPTFDSSSVMCGKCALGYVRQKEVCTICPETGVGVTLAVLCTLFLVAFICFSGSPANSGSYFGSQSRRESGSVVHRILLSFLSTLTTIGDFRARGPQLVQDFIGFTSTVSGGLNVRFAPIRCTLGLSFMAELLVTLGMPLFLLGFCATVVAARSRLDRHFRARQAMLGCAVFTAFLVYPTLTRATLQVFRCTGVEVDGSRYLLHDLSVHCFRGTHSAAMLVSALATTLVGLGVPATIISRVATSRTSGARLQLKRTYQFIFDGYRANRLMWWEALVLLRKFALQCVEVFIADATIQASVASWIIVAAVALHLWWRPYNSALLNRLDALSLSVSYVTQALSSAYPILLISVSGGNGAGFVEAMVTVALLGLNVGTILAMGTLALRMSPVFRRLRRAPQPGTHVVTASSPSAVLRREATAVATVAPAPAVVASARVTAVPSSGGVEDPSLNSEATRTAGASTASCNAGRQESNSAVTPRRSVRATLVRLLPSPAPAAVDGAGGGGGGEVEVSSRHHHRHHHRHPSRSKTGLRSRPSASSSASAPSHRHRRALHKSGNNSPRRRPGGGNAPVERSNTRRMCSSHRRNNTREQSARP